MNDAVSTDSSVLTFTVSLGSPEAVIVAPGTTTNAAVDCSSSTDNIDIATLAEVVRDEIDPTLGIRSTEAREGDAEYTHADISKANRLIGYEPSRDIREGVGDFIEWYKQNRNWYEPLVVTS